MNIICFLFFLYLSVAIIPIIKITVVNWKGQCPFSNYIFFTPTVQIAYTERSGTSSYYIIVIFKSQTDKLIQRAMSLLLFLLLILGPYGAITSCHSVGVIEICRGSAIKSCYIKKGVILLTTFRHLFILCVPDFSDTPTLIINGGLLMLLIIKSRAWI